MEENQFMLMVLRHLANGHNAQARDAIKQLAEFWYPSPPAEVKAAVEEAKMAPRPTLAGPKKASPIPKAAPSKSDPTGL